MDHNKAILLILDGWGHGQDAKASAIAQADTPFVDSLYSKYPNAELTTFGLKVGLPEGQMGNSEVGHLNIGAGRVVYQELARINKEIEDKTLELNPVLREGLAYASQHNRDLHLIGLVSDGGVHSHIDHIKALSTIVANAGVAHTYIHAFTDGRDTDPKSGLLYITELENYIKELPVSIASIIGRYYAMDRDKRWDRVKLAYDLLVHGKGDIFSEPKDAIQKEYDNNITDEFLPPISIRKKGAKPNVIKDGDVVVFFNFRTDRPRQLTEVLTQKDFPEFEMKKLDLKFLCMTAYDQNFKNLDIIFTKDDLKNTLGEVISKNGLTQIRIAETEKYPHVTFFFSGGREQEFEGEKRLMVPSPKVATYDLEPEMSAEKIKSAIIQEINKNQPDFICLNFANTDMVGHTGVFKAAMIAAETVDKCVKEIVETALSFDYEIIIIADHGNSDFMINPDGSPNTAHTLNPVPIFYVSNHSNGKTVKDGKLADVATTILKLMHVEASKEMTGENLISNK